ncbi:MAG: hypothetical protein C0401_11775 [Anaerolinea sp.]|nr:hypothetical protein [Anaerolinea sp.]
MDTNKSQHNKRTYTRDQYQKVFFPSKNRIEFPEAETPYELGVKLAIKAVNHLNNILKKQR